MMTRTTRVLNGSLVTVNSQKATPKLLRLEGYVITGTSATQYFLQLFNAVPTSGSTIPLRSLQVLGGTGFTFDYGMIGLDTKNMPNIATGGNLYVALSSTQDVYTNAGGTAVVGNIFVETEEYGLASYGMTTATSSGSLTTVASDGAGHPRLVAVRVTNNNAVAAFLQIFNVDPSVSGNETKMMRNLPVGASETQYFWFSTTGINIESQDANGTNHNGLYVGASQTAASYDGAGNFTFAIDYFA